MIYEKVVDILKKIFFFDNWQLLDLMIAKSNTYFGIIFYCNLQHTEKNQTVLK